MGKRPHGTPGVYLFILASMKMSTPKKTLTFGEFITGVYDGCGKRKASGIVWMAVNTHFVKFQKHQRYIVS